jgi:hypothetical protein
VESYKVEQGDRIYQAAISELPPEVARQSKAKTLEDLCKKVATGLKGTVIELKASRLDGIEGREIIFDYIRPETGKPTTGRLRVFLIDSTVYSLTYKGPKGTAKTPEVNQFLDSLKITRQPTPARRKARL